MLPLDTVAKLDRLYRAWVSASGPLDLNKLYRAIYREKHAIESGKVKASRQLLREVRSDLAFVGRALKAERKSNPEWIQSGGVHIDIGTDNKGRTRVNPSKHKGRIKRKQITDASYIGRPSQITRRKPTKRLQKRRKSQLQVMRALGTAYPGVFPNPAAVKTRAQLARAVASAIRSGVARKLDEASRLIETLKRRGIITAQEHRAWRKQVVNAMGAKLARNPKPLEGYYGFGSEWEVRSYDVWGNAEDGWEVNDSFRVGTVSFADNASDETIISVLKNAGILSEKASVKNIDIDGDDDFITLNDSRDGMPLLELAKSS